MTTETLTAAEFDDSDEPITEEWLREQPYWAKEPPPYEHVWVIRRDDFVLKLCFGHGRMLLIHDAEGDGPFIENPTRSQLRNLLAALNPSEGE